MNKTAIGVVVFLLASFQIAFSQNPDSIPFAPAVDYETGGGPFSVFASDLDGDGDNDLVTANVSDNTVSVLKNNGDGTFAVKVDYGTGNFPNSVFATDLDGDANNDNQVGLIDIIYLANYIFKDGPPPQPATCCL